MHRTLGLCLCLTATLPAAQPETRPATVSLNGTWEFQLARSSAEAERLAGFHDPAFDARSFRPTPVPSNWALEGFEEPMYARLSEAGEGFYRRRFTAPQSFEGRRVLLHFGGVWASAEVWLNGSWLGRHDSGFTSFAYDVSGLLRPGADNLLAVRVRQITRDYLFDVNDDWSLGGIYRDVWLESMPADRYIERLETNASFDAGYRDADLQVRALVKETRILRGPYELRVALAGPDGRAAGEAKIEVPGHPDTGRDTILKLHLHSPLHWTAETPHLYRLQVELLVQGRVTHSRQHAVGFREVSTAGGVLRINGQAVKLRGVCRHDEHPDVGIATRREHWLQDLRLMKAANINAVRTVHYPPAEGFLDLCDQMGIYVIDEVPMGYGGGLAADPSYASSALLRMHETIVRDRNHPSVIIWSISNENPLAALHLAAARYVKGFDPSRPVLLPWHPNWEAPAFWPQHPGAWLPPEIDILAPHYPTAAQAETMTAQATRPVIATEYSHAWGETNFGGLAERWEALTKHPAGAGGMIWMWQDQGLRKRGPSPSGSGPDYLLKIDGWDGIVRSDRSPQRDYWETQAVYAPVAVLVEKQSWAPGTRALRLPVRNDHDFTDLAALTIHWKLMADEHELAAGDARVEARPHTTGWFELPVAALGSSPPEGALYAHLEFRRPDGSVITRRSVEILVERPPRAPEPGAKLTVHKRRLVAVGAGPIRYEFDPELGQLVSVWAGGRRLIQRAAMTLWRPLDELEILAHARGGFDARKLPDLDRYTTKLRRWSVTQNQDLVTILAGVDHQASERDVFPAEYRYTVRRDGTLEVAYTIRPRIQAPWVPEVGMELEIDPSLEQFRWLGRGPFEAFPNLKAAAIFGLWSGPVSSEAARGMKAEVRWAELSDPQARGIRFEKCGYVRIVRPGCVRVLSAAEGRASKYRRAESPEHRLDVGPSTEFAGSFDLRPLLPQAQAAQLPRSAE